MALGRTGRAAVTDDHTPCPRCKYENARCACPKGVKNPPRAPLSVRIALTKEIKEAAGRRQAPSRRTIR